MSLTDPPAIITLLDTALQACASFPGGATTWYPSCAPSASGTVFILAATNQQRRKFAAGAQGLPTASCEIVLRGDYSIGAIEALAATLLDELLTADAPLHFTDGNVGLCSDPDPGDIAGGETRRAISITLEVGLAA